MPPPHYVWGAVNDVAQKFRKLMNLWSHLRLPNFFKRIKINFYIWTSSSSSWTCFRRRFSAQMSSSANWSEHSFRCPFSSFLSSSAFPLPSLTLCRTLPTRPQTPLAFLILLLPLVFLKFKTSFSKFYS